MNESRVTWRTVTDPKTEPTHVIVFAERWGRVEVDIYEPHLPPRLTSIPVSDLLAYVRIFRPVVVHMRGTIYEIGLTGLGVDETPGNPGRAGDGIKP